MEKMKKISALLAGIFMSLQCFSSCGKSEDVVLPEESVSDIVWTCSGAEKILRNVDYGEKRENKELKISAFRNENESAQIVITPEEKSEYTIALNDLKSAEGAVLSKESFSVYAEKYILLSTIFNSGNDRPEGYYPDAIVPYEKTVEYRENVIEKGCNQAIWVTVKPSKEQAAGEYSGDFILKVNQKDYEVPVTVVVYDYTLSDKTHFKTSFGSYWPYTQTAELDSTEELLTAYYEYYLDHRVMPECLPIALDGGWDIYGNDEENKIEDCIVKYAKDDRCSMLSIKLISRRANVRVVNEDGSEEEWELSTVSESHYLNIMKKLIRRSVNEGFNVIEKTQTYITFVDEFDSAGSVKGIATAKNALLQLKKCDAQLVEYIQSLEPINPDMTAEEFEALKAEMILHMQNMQHKIPSTSYKSIENCTVVEGNVAYTWVPTIDKYTSQQQREEARAYARDNNNELWTYTAVNPKTPYCTYQIDDILLSPRLLSWMCYGYDIQGNLFWETQYNPGLGASGKDYYQWATRFPGTNGDGVLVYPGRYYGIKGPIGTIRLDAIRDGNEDYDLLYELEEMYKAKKVEENCFDQLFRLMTNSLYSDAMITYSNKNLVNDFLSGRDFLAELLSLVANTDMVVSSFSMKNDELRLSLKTSLQKSVECAGAKIEEKREGDDYIYQITKKLTESDLRADILVRHEGKKYSLSFAMKGIGKICDATFLKDNVKPARTDVLLNAEAETSEEEQVLKIKVTDEENGKPAFVADVSGAEIDSRYNSVTVRIYVENPVKLKISGKCAKTSAFQQVYEELLQAGWNEIVFDIASFDRIQNGNFSDIRFSFSEENDGIIETPVTLSLASISFGV